MAPDMIIRINSRVLPAKNSNTSKRSAMFQTLTMVSCKRVLLNLSVCDFYRGGQAKDSDVPVRVLLVCCCLSIEEMLKNVSAVLEPASAEVYFFPERDT